MNKPPQPHKIFTWFLLGREPLLSTAELFSLLTITEKDDYQYCPPFLLLNRNVAADLINHLGGTIKIGKEIGSELDETQLLNLLKNQLREREGKLTFGISLFGEKANAKIVETWGKKLKQDLKSEGRSVRYVYKNETALSSVTVKKNGLIDAGIEFLVFKNGQGKFKAAQTIAVQPFESFSTRDFDRPERDSTSGLLPPKLALMMINLASPSTTDSLLDPFCGSGTIVSEALLLGFKKIYATDQSAKAVSATQNNLNWQTSSHPELANREVIIKLADVKNLNQKIEKNSIAAIVTEPYLGKPLRGSESTTDLKKQADELLELYQTAFVEFKKILHPGGRVVFIIPQFITNNLPIVISDRLVPAVKKMGFTPNRPLPEKISNKNFLVYHRSDQRVAREIWSFTLA